VNAIMDSGFLTKRVAYTGDPKESQYVAAACEERIGG
jgi:hypothetical protein